MENAPAYLVVYFVRIKHLANKENALLRRLSEKNEQAVLDELSMLKSLEALGFVTLCKDHVWLRIGESNYQVPESFALLARGRHWWTELAAGILAWASASAVGAVIGTLATRAVCAI